MPLLVGTSGWQYADWRTAVYPGVPQRRWFEHVLTLFRTVELNVTFYRLPKREVFAGWHERSPADAVLAVKASRYLTHVRRLREPAEPVARLMERVEPLSGKLGPVLLQLPPDLGAGDGALERLAETLDAFPAGVRLAVEPRHRSWWSDDLRGLLTERGAALVWADRGSRPLGPLWRTAPWGYLRLHMGLARPWPRYGRTALRSWVRRLAAAYDDSEDVHVYFNNDPGAAAVVDARTFGRIALRAGRTVSRLPPPAPR